MSKVTNWHRQAIRTKYLGPTDSQGSRVKATAAAGSITLSWDDALGIDDNHDTAALTLAEKYHWLDRGARLVGGGDPSGEGNVYVIVEE